MTTIVDVSDPEQYHYNYNIDGVGLYYNLDLNQPIPVGAPFVWLKYCRYFVGRTARVYANMFIQNNYVEDGDSVLVVGDGFGWMNEAFRELLPNSQVVSTEISPWIHSVKNQSDADTIRSWCENPNRYRAAPVMREPTHRPFILTAEQVDEWTSIFSTGTWARVDLHDEDLLSAGSANRIRNKVSGGKFRFGFSADVLPWVTDDAAKTLAQTMRTVADKTAHLVSDYSTEEYEQGLEHGNHSDWNWKRVWPLNETLKGREKPIHARLWQNPWYTEGSWKELLPNERFENGTVFRGTGADIDGTPAPNLPQRR